MPLHAGDREKRTMACGLLPSEHGFYIQAINYLAVPRGLERLRITPPPYHDDALIGRPAGALADV